MSDRSNVAAGTSNVSSGGGRRRKANWGCVGCRTQKRRCIVDTDSRSATGAQTCERCAKGNKECQFVMSPNPNHTVRKARAAARSANLMYEQGITSTSAAISTSGVSGMSSPSTLAAGTTVNQENSPGGPLEDDTEATNVLFPSGLMDRQLAQQIQEVETASGLSLTSLREGPMMFYVRVPEIPGTTQPSSPSAEFSEAVDNPHSNGASPLGYVRSPSDQTLWDQEPYVPQSYLRGAEYVSRSFTSSPTGPDLASPTGWTDRQPLQDLPRHLLLPVPHFQDQGQAAGRGFGDGRQSPVDNSYPWRENRLPSLLGQSSLPSIENSALRPNADASHDTYGLRSPWEESQTRDLHRDGGA